MHSILKRSLSGLSLSLVLLITLSVGTQAHHVEVAEPSSDSEAFAIYLSEYEAQKAGLRELYQIIETTTSAAEKADATVTLQTGLAVTIEHMESLTRPACMDIIHELVIEELTAVGRSTSTENPVLASKLISYAGTIGSATKDEVVSTLFDCAPPVVDEPDVSDVTA